MAPATAESRKVSLHETNIGRWLGWINERGQETVKDTRFFQKGNQTYAGINDRRHWQHTPPAVAEDVVVPPKHANGTTPVGWRAFRPPDSYLARPFPVEPTVAQRLPCVDQWVAHGQACAWTSAEPLRLDALWTWINGSEPILAATRDQVVGAAMKKKKGRYQPVFLGSRTSHFRTHGEMINSMRSVLKSMPSELVQKYILLTADVAADDTEELRLGSVPTWLDLEAGVQVLHHSDVFRIPRSLLPTDGDIERQGHEWRDDIVPSFNSLAIESQLPNIPNLAPTIFYLNDDCFLLRPLSVADFETPLYGPVLRIQFDLGVKSRPPDSFGLFGDKEGEWPSLEFNQRFGKRSRRYLHHIAKVLSTPLMREAAAIWEDELARTAEARFRGHGPQVNLVYLVTWYNIEKHRESLLYSFIMLRVDADADGVISPAERSTLVAGLESGKVNVALREGGSPHYVALNLQRAGIAEPKETEYTWISSDGYPLIRTTRTKTSAHCAIDVKRCFAGSSSLGVFRRVAFEEPDCGDCLIAHLISKSGPVGLEAFLPHPQAPNATPPAALPAKRWQDAVFAPGLGREYAVDRM
ncbi:hypothetical protein GGX14DRAFT_417010 [Mycena pura]|uniref:Stealth protein CR3 conserved region 3 domain-containing protein n=1 Tax=Mycena pura TaxID=153505 RepID=A0AAD7E593_9AGAR|nr:hypothetical protein GGX14DRAFT_417010 [Mycena pura]